MDIQMDRDKIKELSILTKEEWREYTRNVWHIANVSNKDHPAVFPIEIPHRLIKLFSFWGECVLDPFAGIGTTAKAALELGRRAICYEQNPKYIRIMKKFFLGHSRQMRIDESTEQDVIIQQGDSRKLLLDSKDDSIDIIVTSPPYWDKADYGKRAENLGNIKKYSEFFSEIKPVFEHSFRVLKPGRKICIVTANVNLYTELGLLTFPLGADYINLLREIGFVLVTDVIWSKDGTGGKWGSWGKQRPIFGSYPYPPNLLFKNVYEHILIFEKPDRRKKRSAKAKLMSDVM